MSKEIKQLYGLNEKEQKKAIKIYRNVTGHKKINNQMDSALFGRILFELSEEKFLRSPR